MLEPLAFKKRKVGGEGHPEALENQGGLLPQWGPLVQGQRQQRERWKKMGKTGPAG